MAVIDRRPGTFPPTSLFHARAVGKLRAIVYGDRPKYLVEKGAVFALERV